MWFTFTIICILSWGTADLFYKTSANEKSKYTYLKTAILVGLIMGIHAIFTMIFEKIHYNPMNLLVYAPVSLSYILSMIIGYFGLKYLELSISSPIQNSSGVIVCILCFFLLGERINTLGTIAIVCICLGIFLLGILERNKEKKKIGSNKYQKGIIAFFIPIIYCIFDAAGTFLDAFYLNDAETTLLIGANEQNLESIANISYELTFFIGALVLILFLAIKKEKMEIAIIKKSSIAAIFETVGQYFYVFAMSKNAIVAAPVVSSYCVISMILSRIILKEKLTKKQYFAISIIIIGISTLGIMENY